MPNDLYKKASDPTPFKSVVSAAEPPMTTHKIGRTDVPDLVPGYPHQTLADMQAHKVAEEAGGFRKHGANGNLVHSKSAAIAPHDKDR